MPETETAATKTPKPSLRSLIEWLDVGESHAVVKKFTLDTVTSEDIVRTREQMHDTVTAAVSRARRGSTRVYECELGDFRTTRGHNPILCIVVTRKT